MDALGINLPGLVTQIISFGILFFILSKLLYKPLVSLMDQRAEKIREGLEASNICLLYTSPSPRDKRQSRMPSSA